MKARENGDCDACGAPVDKDVTHVSYDRGVVVACEECRPELANAAENEDDDSVKTIRVRVGPRIWEKPDGSWSIYRVALDGNRLPWMPDAASQSFGLCGPVGALTRGDVVMVSGRFKTSPKYGFQFEAVSQAQLAIRESEAGLVAFLSRFPQVGPIRAQSLLRRFGMAGILERLDSEEGYKDLAQVEGITEERAAEIKVDYDKTAGFREFRLFAAELGLNEATIAAAIDTWGDEARAVIEFDPFELMDLPKGSFTLADQVREKLGGDPKSQSRCAAGVFLALQAMDSEGHTYIDEEELKSLPRGRVGEQLRRLNLAAEEIEFGLQLLERWREKKTRKGVMIWVEPRVTRTEGRIYLREVEQAERAIVSHIRRLRSATLKTVPYPSCAFDGIEPAPEQVEALQLACDEGFMIMTGGPGVGKTRVTNEILNAMEAAGYRVACCAPTGKAAKRMTELTGRAAGTIHKLIGLREASSSQFTIDAGVLVVDEASMVDTVLMANLLECVQTGTRVVIVGDVDQLPSIGAGRVLHDLIESGTVPVVRLTKIFRQESDGVTKRIPEVARDINTGLCPDLAVKGTDVVFLEMHDTDEIQRKILMAVTEQIPQKYGIPVENIQVIAAQKGEVGKANWPIGTKSLNHVLQDVLNPRLDFEMHIGEGYVVRANDRVMHTKNNYDLTVMNGDQGVVTRLDPKGFIPEAEVITSFRTRRAKDAEAADDRRVCPVCKDLDSKTMSCSLCSQQIRPARRSSGAEKPTVVLTVDYADGRVVGYTREEARELQLSYAITCHKSQGSQYDAVVIPVHDAHGFMLTRGLLYTALTRASKYVLLIGQSMRVAKAVLNTRGSERRTSLCQRLLDAVAETMEEYLREEMPEAEREMQREDW